MMELWREVQKRYPEANFLQSPAWGKMNDLIGHKVIVEYNLGDAKTDVGRDTADHETSWSSETLLDSNSKGAPQYWCQMIVKDARRGRYLEVPGGPLVDWADAEQVKFVFTKIRQVAESEKCVFVRLRPQLRANQAEHLKGLGLHKAPMHLHAEHTIILDLTKPETELLAEMRRQTRYEVRRAEKQNIKVEWDNSEALFREFQQVQAETAERQHFIPPDLKTLLAERTAFGDQARLYVARTEMGEPIAYGLILIDGIEAEYFEAASTELNHKMPGAYALQWQVIRDLKNLGLKRYNLWGIAPPGQPEHRYARVTTFKKGFGGEVVEFVPAQDMIIKPGLYKIDLAIETMRRKRRKL